ncbi:hypothetical protein [Vampirovibrio sp.]|uniref:hypothetical protein n=1 Tax=Vampirovibrio sp. TaxID=2717857 RepID=UPI00359353A5
MALRQNEKTLVGAALVAGGIAIFVGLGLPQFDAYTANTTQFNALSDELKNLQIEKDSLTGQIAILEKNTDIPPDIKVKTFTEDTREVVIKQMLDQVVGLATGAGNKFISLAPAEVDPLISSSATASAEGEPAADATNAPADAATPEEGAEGEPVAPPPPMLTTFGYQLAVRGTYNTIQSFLRLMAQEKELMEMTAINVVNESNNKDTAGATDTLYDPGSPIKLMVTIRLAMQQVAP